MFEINILLNEATEEILNEKSSYLKITGIYLKLYFDLTLKGGII